MIERQNMSLRTLDLFCGGGGSSWGAKAAGAQIVAGIDAWEVATANFHANFPEAEAFQETLDEATDPSDFDRIGDIDLILASPECTNHTCARGSRPRDEASRRTANYVSGFVRHFEPRWVVIENVIQMRTWDGYDPLVNELEGLGYKVTPQVLDAAAFGAPQKRRRLFLMCDRDRTPPDVAPGQVAPVPASSILEPPDRFQSRPLHRPGRAENTIARYQRGVEALGEGTDFLLVYYGSDGSGGWQPLDVPLRTLTTLDRFGLVTWKDEVPYLRMLQVPELLRAMGFDLCESGHRYEFSHGSRRDRIKLIGNGVAPPVMQAIVENLVRPRMTMPIAAE